ncbi:MAG: cytochrome c peroxidase [bacterium]|jgi:cytochrome c peroxidase
MKYLIKLVTLLFVIIAPLSSFAFEKIGVPDKSTIEYPDEDAPSKELVQLGKMLFFDTRLSVNNKQSCATCHNPDLGLGEGKAAGIGTMGGKLGRNTPHIYNLAWNVVFFWDGRSKSLEDQALGPIQAAGEMNMSLKRLIPKLKRVPYYKRRFKALFPKKGLTSKNLAKAIAAFERSIIIDNTPFDRYMKGDIAAMSPAAIRGMKLFEGKARCVLCHGGANFTDNGFHNIGIGGRDLGRSKIQKGAANRGAFKTPGLRNVLFTAPYMHNGSMGSLEEVIRHYNKGGKKVRGLDSLMKPLSLTEKQIFDLIAFLGSINEAKTIKRPQLP